MKNNLNRITNRITLAIVIAGLAIALPPPLSARSSVSAQTKNIDSNGRSAAKARYEVRWEVSPAKGSLPPAYHAPNPAQQYDAFFTPNGLNLVPHRVTPSDTAPAAAFDETAQAREMPEWRTAMMLTGYGYGENLLAVGGAALEARGNRIEYRRAWPPITEWYVNNAGGLEQGFTIEMPPGIRSEGERLRLALELSGDLTAELAKGGASIALKQANGEVTLNYSDLYAYDAQGRELPSRMKLNNGQVILEVDDEKAVYPVTIDPTFSQQAKLSAFNGVNDGKSFGSSVAIYGDTLVIGAPGEDIGSNANQGSVLIFTNINNIWTYQARLTAGDGAANDFFGGSVAINGNTVVVGASYADINSNTDQGAAYVFVGSGRTWSQQQKLTDIGGAAQDGFGTSVAIIADTVAVGAPSFPHPGAVHVFERSGDVWSQQQELMAGDGAAYESFGSRVAIDLKTIVVTAPGDTIGANGQQGSAYVFVRNGSAWSQQAKLIANDGAAGDQFGSSVAISGNTVVVGAHRDTVGSTSLQGSAYVFVRNLSSWNQQAKLIAGDGRANDYFGNSVAISGYTILVGAHYGDVGSNPQQGAAYVFVRSGPWWSQQQKLTAKDGEASDRFGAALAISAGMAVVGAPSDDFFYNRCFCSYPTQGSAYVFRQ